MNKNLAEINKNTRFSKTNQPPNENKRVPKWKYHLKKELQKAYPKINEALIKASEEGSIKHIEFIRDWIYGKNAEVVQHKFDDDNIKELRDIFDDN